MNYSKKGFLFLAERNMSFPYMKTINWAVEQNNKIVSLFTAAVLQYYIALSFPPNAQYTFAESIQKYPIGAF
jgi:hypothetical protein